MNSAVLPPRVVQLTDTHIYADPGARFDGVDTRASCRAVLDAALRDEPAAQLLMTGDISMDGSPASYAWVSETLATLGRTAVLIAGNHDEPQAWPAARAPGFHMLPGSLTAGAWSLHLLDTRIAGQPHGAVGQAALAALAQTLTASAAGYHAIFMHHPPLALGSPWIDAMGLRDADAFWDCITRSDAVRLVVCGHVHQNHDTWYRGVRVLTTPSTCVQFAPSTQRYAVDRRAPGYRVIEFGDDGSVLTAVKRVAVASPAA